MKARTLQKISQVTSCF